MDFWPEFEETKHNRFRQRGIFLQKLDDAVGKLRMVNWQRFDFVQRHQDFKQKHFMLLFQWKSKTIDDASQYFQQFSNAIVMFSFINKSGQKIDISKKY